MVTPYVSPYDTSPWQPTVYTNQDPSDQQAAAEQYDKIYGGHYKTADQSYNASPSSDNPSLADMPDVYMAYTQAPDLVPTVPPGQGAPSDISNAEVLDTMPFYIELAALRNTENVFLGATSASIDGYNNLKSIVADATQSQTIFGQHVGDNYYPGDPPAVKGGWLPAPKGVPSPAAGGGFPVNGPADNPTYGREDPLNKEGQAFAASTDSGMTQLCASICAVLELCGVFTALLNNTGQMFTYTDSNCRFPPMLNPTMHTG
jgi:hypothetical protein